MVKARERPINVSYAGSAQFPMADQKLHTATAQSGFCVRPSAV